jgi:uncharacterized protein YlxW (UPF0749 family)
MLTAFFQGLNAYAGLFSMLIVIIGAYFASKNMAKSKASEEANNTQQRTISALQGTVSTLQADIGSLQRKVDELKSENRHQERVIETICLALKSEGIMITIDGEVISIKGLEESKKSATIVRIQDSKEGS